MIRAIQNAMRLQAQRAVAAVKSSLIGQITSYDPNTFTARVQLQSEDSETGWLPIASPWIGNGWGAFFAPNIGDMVTVDFINGDMEAGTVIARFWNFEDLPLAVQSGEMWIVHKSGAFFKLTNDGKVSFSDGQGATLQMDGEGNIVSQANKWTHTGEMDIDGPVHITGTTTITGAANVSQTLTATTDVVGGGVSLKTHVHSGVQTGGGTSGPPVP